MYEMISIVIITRRAKRGTGGNVCDTWSEYKTLRAARNKEGVMRLIINEDFSVVDLRRQKIFVQNVKLGGCLAIGRSCSMGITPTSMSFQYFIIEGTKYEKENIQ